MLSKKDIYNLLNMLNERLKDNNVYGEIFLYGGAVMCLAFDARDTTKDIDAMFVPKDIIYKHAKNIAEEMELPIDWLNDSVKGFISEHNDMDLHIDKSNLKIYIPNPEYLFAMKCVAARIGAESKDVDDIVFLGEKLDIKKVKQAEKIIHKYFPPHRLLPKTYYLLDEIFTQEDMGDGDDR
jgi:hypothetical protein